MKVYNILSYIGVFLLFIVISSLFVVDETKTVFIVEFGKVVKKIDKPGLYYRIPGIQDIVSFDKRILQVDCPAKEIIASDQKRIIIDSYAKYRISNTEDFYTALQNEKEGMIKIASILDSSVRQIVASYPLLALLTDKRNVIMEEIKDIFGKNIASLGIEVVDVRIIRADLPVENSDAVFNRMITARQKEAAQLRAEGNAEANVVIADAKRQIKEIESKANMDANIIIGNAEAEAIRIYSRSFSQDAEFFAFSKSIDTYKNIFKEKRTIMLSTDNQFLKYLQN